MAADAAKMTAGIVKDNAEIQRLLTECRRAIFCIGQPDVFQCKGYDWNDMMGLLVDITPTPNAEQARAFVDGREDV